MFNTAVESAAFVVSDRDELIKIGLFVCAGPMSKTADRDQRCRRRLRRKVWIGRQRDERVLEATPHHVAQYSPINLGFQVVGWLYGDDFGDAICKAVNCGYDTDCTGATLGSYLGIIATRHGLPERWTAPLGETIATNESWGGIRNASDGPNPVPTDLETRDRRICRAAERVLTEHGLLEGSTLNIDRADLYADDSVRELWSAAPMRLDRTLDAVEVSVDDGVWPVLVAEPSARCRSGSPIAVRSSSSCASDQRARRLDVLKSGAAIADAPSLRRGATGMQRAGAHA